VAASAKGIGGDIPAERTSGGDAMATGYLAECSCFNELSNMARPLIRRFGLQAEIGAEDAANITLYCFCRAMAAGKAPGFEPDGEFWKFARVLLVRVVLHARRQARSIRRGGSGGGDGAASAGRSPALYGSLHRVAVNLDGLQAVGPAVEDLVIASMEEKRLTELLHDPELEHIATMRLQRHTVREIARKISHDHATVCRKLRRIQTIWRESGLDV